MKTKEQIENDNLAQVQGYPNFEDSPKGSNDETIQRIENNLDKIFTEEEEIQMLYKYHRDQMIESSIEDPDDERSLRLVEFYGK